MLEEKEWVLIEEYLDGDYEIAIEGTSVGEIPEDDYDESDLDYYQVYYKRPWELLIGPTKTEPTAQSIHSALNLIEKSPKFLYLNAQLNVLQKLFIQLQDKSKKKNHCIVCGKTAKSDSHDADCPLDQAMRILNR